MRVTRQRQVDSKSRGLREQLRRMLKQNRRAFQRHFAKHVIERARGRSRCEEIVHTEDIQFCAIDIDYLILVSQQLETGAGEPASQRFLRASEDVVIPQAREYAVLCLKRRHGIHEGFNLVTVSGNEVSRKRDDVW